MFEQQKEKLKQANPDCRDSKGRDRCPRCSSYNVEYSNYEWSCLDCGEQWDQYGQDTSGNKKKVARKQLLAFLNEMGLKIPEEATDEKLEGIALKYARSACYPFLSRKLQAFLNVNIQDR